MATESKFNAVLLIGGPGSGKGTQGAVLGRFPYIRHLAMGDIFRAIAPKSDIGREFLAFSTKGMLVPDDLTVRVWKSFVDHAVDAGELDPARHVLLLDGIPRTIDQVELVGMHINILKIAHFVIHDQSILVERLKGRALQGDRPDDAVESVILERMRVYEESTAPVLKSYDSSLIAEIDADQTPLAVLRDLAACLSVCLPAPV